MYTVFGYTDDCREYSANFNSFVQAVKFLRERWYDVVFMHRENVGTCRYLANRF